MPEFPVTSKLWGSEELICSEPEYTAKYLNIAPGGMCSLHYHKIKKETFTVIAGSCSIRVRDQKVPRLLREGDQITILPGQTHRFWVEPSCKPCRILEVSMHHDDADSYRLEPSQRLINL